MCLAKTEKERDLPSTVILINTVRLKMKFFETPILIWMTFSMLAFGDDPVDIYRADLEKAKARYRVNQAAVLKKADRVVLYLVSFDGFTNGSLDDDGGEIHIGPYNRWTKILKKRELEQIDSTKVLTALTKQIAEPEQSGGAFCHYPIHGIRIYKGDELLHEGTFCWVCSNFGFDYPNDSDWLDTTDELKTLFTKLLPIPQEELERFHEEYPQRKRKGEQDVAEQPEER